jgi:hypothetical protein
MPGRGEVRHRALGALILGMLALSACAASASSAAQPTATATEPPSGPTPTVFVPTPGDTSVCDAISPAEFAHVADTTATEITSGATEDSLTGLNEVYCIYDDASDPHTFLARGTINYEIAADSATAASIFVRVKQSFGGVSDVTGVGDAAFAGTPGGAPSGSGYGLLVLRGSLLMYLSVAGDEETVVRVTTSLAALALGRVA